MAPFPPTCSAILPMNAKDYFLERDSAPFRALLAEMLNLGQVEIVDTWKEGKIRFQKMVTVPDYERWVPTIGRKYVKEEDIMFYDTIAYDPQELDSEEKGFRMHVTSYLPLLGDKMTGVRTIVIKAVDENHCRHSVEGDINIKVFGVGRLAEKTVIDSTVKTFKALPTMVERYNMVREEILRAPGGREALLHGIPDVLLELPSFDMAKIGSILQKPFEELDMGDISDDDGNEFDVVSELMEEGTSIQAEDTPDKSLMRSDMLFYDADEESDWMDPEWVRALEESTNNLGEADAATAAALVHEERRALARLRKMAPSHIRTVLLSRSSFHERTGPLKRNREDEEKRKRFNADAKKWRQFWRKAHPAAPPVPSITAQAFHLLSISAAVGWIKMHSPSKKGSGEEEKAKPQGERLAQVKKLFGKMHLGKKERARVTTPAALP